MDLNQLLDDIDKKIEKKISDSRIEPLKQEVLNFVNDIGDKLGAKIEEAITKLPQPLAPQVHIEPIQIPEIKSPNVTVNVPEAKPVVIPPFPKIPAPQVTVNVPPTKIPDLKWPSENMPIEGWVRLQGVDMLHPLPVTITNAKDIAGGGSSMVAGGGGNAFITNDSTHPIPVSGSFSVSGSSTTAAIPTNNDGVTYNSDNPLPVTGSFTSTPGLQISGASDSVNIAQYGGTTVPTGLNETTNGVMRTILMTDSVVSVNIVSGSSSGAIGQGDGATATRVIQAGDSVSSVNIISTVDLTDTQLRASSVPIMQVSGAIDSVNITNSSLAVTGTFFQTTQPVSIAATTGVDQVSGANWSVTVSNTVPVTGTFFQTTQPVSLAGPVAQGDAASALRVVIAGNSDTSVVVNSMPAVVVTSITNSVAANIVDSSGVAYSGSNPLPITGSLSTTPGGTYFASDAVLSVNILQNFGNDTRVGTGYQDNALRVVNATDAVTSVNITNSSLAVTGTFFQSTQPVSIAATTGVDQLSGANWSVFATNPVAQGDAATALRVIIAGNSDASVVVNSMPAVVVTSITNTTATNIVDSGGVAYSGSNPVPITGAVTIPTNSSINHAQTAGNTTPVGTGYQDNALRVVNATDAITSVNVVSSAALVVTSITNTTAMTIVDSGGVGYSGSNPLTIGGNVSAFIFGGGGSLVPQGQGESAMALRVIIAGDSGVSVASSVVTGPSAVGVADDGTAPVQVSGIARTANPTKVSGGQVVKASMDAAGRQVMRPVQVRDLIATAQVSLTTGTELTLLAATAGEFHDLIMISLANTSTVAVQVDVREVTAGNIVYSASLPVGPHPPFILAPPVPYPNSATGNNWTVDMPDITGTTVFITALFSKEV